MIKHHATMLGLAFVLIWPAADVDASSAGDKNNKNHANKNSHPNQGSIRTPPVFTPHDRGVIGEYYRNLSSNLPPGLAKRGGKLPPGIERQIQRNGTLPRGLERSITPFPQELSHRLPALSPGYTRGLVGDSAVIVNLRSRAIVDVIHNLLNSSGQ